MCPPMFVAALPSYRNNLQVPINRWIDEDVVYVLNEMLLSHKKKKNETQPFVTTWMKLEGLCKVK